MTDLQLDLPFAGTSFSKAWWAAVLAEMRRVVDRVGLKEVAFALDVRPSVLNHALAERDRHYMRAEWVLLLLTKAEDLGLARALLEPAGASVEMRAELTAEEKLARLEQTLGEALGPDLRRSIYERAWRR